MEGVAEAKDSPLEALGAGALALLLCYWAYQLLTLAQPYIPLDYVNFVTHETGGVLFIFFNQFYFMLGQNVYQNLVPIAFLYYFFRRKDHIACAFCGFWFGESLLQTGNYMKDAQAMLLPITSIWTGDGSGSSNGHDWNYIFSHTGLLPYCTQIGGFFWAIGAICIIGSIGYLLYLSIKSIYPDFTLTVKPGAQNV
ncbi:MAG TPA: hypothetical protein VMU25_01070 [Candidatus Paceibacterota bacterium]|nr:hypothetical protein [Candidatus Paceibacterota bacterium]